MDKLIQLFGCWLQFTYSCFDRIVINGYLPQLYRAESLAYFLRRICGIDRITKEILRGRSKDYQKWVEGYGLNHEIPIAWAETGVRKEEFLRPHLNRFLRQGKTGVYYILKSRERGTTYRILQPRSKQKYPHLKKQRSLYTHYYFYLVDEIFGPMVLRIGSFIPFAATAYLNGHNYVERQLLKRGKQFVKKDNAFVAVESPTFLQQLSDEVSPRIISERLEFWIFRLGPKFSRKERNAAGWALRRLWAVNQIEYCRNFVFKRNFPIRSLFERSCELSLYQLVGSRVANIFGRRVNRRFSGRIHNLFERMDHGQHVFRSYLKTSFVKMYEKMQTFLRLEVVCNDLKYFGLRKSLKYLPEIKNKLQEITDRFAAFQAESLDVHPEFDLFTTLAKPVLLGKTKIAGIRLEQDRINRLLEVLLQGGSSNNWTTTHLRQTLGQRYYLQPQQYTLNQIRYDIRKLRGHNILSRVAGKRRYQLTEKGRKIALMFVLFRKRVYGPIAGSLFLRRPTFNHNSSKTQRAYQRIDDSIDKLFRLLAA